MENKDIENWEDVELSDQELETVSGGRVKNLLFLGFVDSQNGFNGGNDDRGGGGSH